MEAAFFFREHDWVAHLASSVETLNLRVVDSSPTLCKTPCTFLPSVGSVKVIFYCTKSTALVSVFQYDPQIGSKKYQRKQKCTILLLRWWYPLWCTYVKYPWHCVEWLRKWLFPLSYQAKPPFISSLTLPSKTQQYILLPSHCYFHLKLNSVGTFHWSWHGCKPSELCCTRRVERLCFPFFWK